MVPLRPSSLAPGAGRYILPALKIILDFNFQQVYIEGMMLGIRRLIKKLFEHYRPPLSYCARNRKDAYPIRQGRFLVFEG